MEKEQNILEYQEMMKVDVDNSAKLFKTNVDTNI